MYGKYYKEGFSTSFVIVLFSKIEIFIFKWFETTHPHLTFIKIIYQLLGCWAIFVLNNGSKNKLKINKSLKTSHKWSIIRKQPHYISSKLSPKWIVIRTFISYSEPTWNKKNVKRNKIVEMLFFIFNLTCLFIWIWYWINIGCFTLTFSGQEYRKEMKKDKGNLCR